jgi:hypothetical protein
VGLHGFIECELAAALAHTPGKEPNRAWAGVDQYLHDGAVFRRRGSEQPLKRSSRNMIEN